jgi:hypothetical protein
LRVVRPLLEGEAPGLDDETFLFEVEAPGFVDAARVFDRASGSFEASSLPGFFDVTGPFARVVGVGLRAALAALFFSVGLRFVTVAVSSRLDMRVLVLDPVCERGGGS